MARSKVTKLRPSKAILKLFTVLQEPRYRTYSVYDYFVQMRTAEASDAINVVLRIDVDRGLHLAQPLADMLAMRGLNATFYFLTHPGRYYPLWDTDVPKTISDMGFEIGVHSDHYYESLQNGTDALAKIKADVKRLSEAAGGPVRGLTYHGHEAINALGKRNWTPYRDLTPAELGLEYHDGNASSYIRPGSKTWSPNVDHRISDFTAPTSNVWRYYPDLPVRELRKVRPGESVHIAFHPPSAFTRSNWESPYDEEAPPQVDPIEFAGTWLRSRWVVQLGLPTPLRVARYALRRITGAYRGVVAR